MSSQFKKSARVKCQYGDLVVGKKRIKKLARQKCAGASGGGTD